MPEVCIFFENELMRGNRTTKINAENFNAFRSFNYPSLAHAGIHIKYDAHIIRRPDPTRPMKPHYLFDTNVVMLTLFPGIQESIINSVLHVPGLKAVVLKPSVPVMPLKRNGSSSNSKMLLSAVSLL